jgi:predicted Zn-dependent protease with MMP-like domain
MKDDLEDRAIAAALNVEEKIESSPYSALVFAESMAPEISRHPEVRLAKSRALKAHRGAKAALSDLERLVADEPDFAEARHELGLVYEELGEEAAQSTQMLQVLELDARADEEDGFDFDDTSQRMIATAQQVIKKLPIKVRWRVAEVPIVIEARPTEELVRQGVDPRTLGYFEGADYADRMNLGSRENPTRIVLYAANLAAYAGIDDEEALAAEIEVTILHEISHYFGLDEDEVAALGYR